MTTYGYVLQHRYNGDGVFEIQVRIPSIHGPYHQADYKGQTVRNYTLDDDCPWYPSLLLPHKPVTGEVVAVTTLDSGNTNFLVIGLTGGAYGSSQTNIRG